jgi:hypothetical protein
MGSVYRFAFLSFLSFIFAVNLASTYKELIMEYSKQEHRESIMLSVSSLLSELIPEHPDKIESLEPIDALVCEALGIDHIDEPPEFLLIP